jgi:prepilin-type N-terminal cleavage/methylation domain-containing protein
MNTKKGFTLIELLVVIAIIGVLSSVVLASLNTARQKSRDAKRISDLKQLQLALELYFDAHRAYPTAAQFTANLKSEGFIAAIPVDPIGDTAYHYAGLSSTAGGACSSYHLGATLEESTHVGLANDIDAAAGTLCSGGGTDFPGADSGECASADNGTACYDLKP